MDKIIQQDNNPEIKRLRQLLHSIPVPRKDEHAWQAIEDRLIDQVHGAASARGMKKRAVLFEFPSAAIPAFPSRILAYASAACLAVLLGTGGLIFSLSRTFPGQLAHSRILDIKGSVVYLPAPGSAQESSPGSVQSGPVLFKNQVFKTGEGSTCMVRIDARSSFVLSGKTTLIVQRANNRHIDFFLSEGGILASIGKRAAEQTFTIHTPNAACTVIGTVFHVAVSAGIPEKKITNLTVLEGKVSFTNRNNAGISGLVTAGTASVMHEGSVSAPEPVSGDPQFFCELALLKSAEHDTAAASECIALLDISSTPDHAEIIINGKTVGTTPYLFSYPAGSHSIILSLPGYAHWKSTVNADGNATTRVFAALAPAPEDETGVIRLGNIPKKFRSSLPLMPPAPVTSAGSTEPETKASKDFGFIMNPSFVEALVQMTIGEYQKALVILDSLKDLPEISITEKIRIMSKISACYRAMGNFEHTLTNLYKRYEQSVDPAERSTLLWEIIIVKANCLQDYAGAEADILNYIAQHPRDAWTESAYAKLGEIQYITGKYAKAIGTYQYHITLFKTSDQVERSVYTLANIMRQDIKDYTMAVKWYSKLLREYPSSIYFGNALFERADCYEHLNQPVKARKDYSEYLSRFPEGHLKALCQSRIGAD
jgi:tetratricopeptide (TPR) repeat protein